MGRVVGLTGDHDQALAALRKAAEVGGPTAELWLAQSMALFELEHFPEAAECAQHAVEMDPQSATAWRVLGRAAGLTGDYKQALEAFRKAADVGEPTAELWRLQSVALRSLGRHPEALAAAEQACDLVPDHPEMILTVVLSLWKLGRHEDALARLEAAPQAANTPELLLRKAWCLVRLQRADDALTAVDQAETIGASPREVHRFRGDILLLAGRYAEALEDLDAALTVEPQYWSPAADREIALACLGRHGKRMEALPVALAAVPIPPRDLAGVCEYILGVASGALRKGEADVGLNLLRAVLAMEAWHELDWYGAQMGTFLRHVLQLVPERFADAVDMVRATVRNADVLRLVDPFIQAVEYFRTGDVTILERLFPEVREVVMEIAERLGRPRPTGLLANG